MLEVWGAGASRLDHDLAAGAEVPGTSYRTVGAGADDVEQEEPAGHETGHRRHARAVRTGPLP